MTRNAIRTKTTKNAKKTPETTRNDKTRNAIRTKTPKKAKKTQQNRQQTRDSERRNTRGETPPYCTALVLIQEETLPC
jgi:hypothetical protein